MSPGFRLADGRRGGFSWDSRPRCVAGRAPHGHRIKPATGLSVLTEAVLTCVHTDRLSGEQCGVRQYVARLQPEAELVVWVSIEVTDELVRQLRARPAMTFLERMQLLDVVLPGVDVDLAVSSHALPPDALR